MILSDVFERFSQDAPLSVMAQGVMENALNPQILDQLFEDVAQKQFTHKLLFSTIIDLMSVVVCRIRPSIHAAFHTTPLVFSRHFPCNNACCSGKPLFS